MQTLVLTQGDYNGLCGTELESDLKFNDETKPSASQRPAFPATSGLVSIKYSRPSPAWDKRHHPSLTSTFRGGPGTINRVSASTMSEKRRAEIEAKKAKLAELRRLREDRRRADNERRNAEVFSASDLIYTRLRTDNFNSVA